MLINLSNHPSSLWSARQTDCATSIYGDIIDLPFPAVNPEGDEEYIAKLVKKYWQKIEGLAGQARNDGSVAVHIMGELTFTFAMVKALQAKEIRCVASTTERVAKEVNGVKTSEFKFVMFREYSNFFNPLPNA
jgi:hypothetical protein